MNAHLLLVLCVIVTCRVSRGCPVLNVRARADARETGLEVAAAACGRGPRCAGWSKRCDLPKLGALVRWVRWQSMLRWRRRPGALSRTRRRGCTTRGCGSGGHFHLARIRAFGRRTSRTARACGAGGWSARRGLHRTLFASCRCTWRRWRYSGMCADFSCALLWAVPRRPPPRAECQLRAGERQPLTRRDVPAARFP